MEQRPLITRRVAGLYISDHAAWRRERTNAFTTQCRALPKAPSSYLSLHSSPPFSPPRFSFASLPLTTRPSSDLACFSPLREDQSYARVPLSPLLSFLPSPNGRIYIAAKKSSLFASRDIRRVFERTTGQGFEIAGRLSTSSKRCRGRRVSLDDRIFPPLARRNFVTFAMENLKGKQSLENLYNSPNIDDSSFPSFFRESNRMKQCNRRRLTFHATSSRGGNRVA